MNDGLVEGPGLDPASLPSELDGCTVHPSIVRGNPPASGPRPSPYRWTNVVDSEAPDPRTRSLGAYVVYHEMEVGPEVRVAYTTRIDVFPSDDDALPDAGPVLVEEQVNVHKRAFLKRMDELRGRIESSRDRWRQRVLDRTEHRHETVERLPSQRARRASHRVVDAVAAAIAYVVLGLHEIALDLVEIPDQIVTAGLQAHAVLHSHMGRRTVWESLWEPRELTFAQRSVTISVVAVAAFVAVLFLNSLFALVFPQWAGVYRYSLGLAVSMVLGVLFLPVLVEPMLIVSMLAVGPVAAFTGMLVGKVVGAWILYLVGITLIDTVRSWTEDRPRIDRTVEWMTETADEHAFPLLFVGNLAPFVSGFFLYVYAVAGVRFRAWVAGVTLGTAARFAAIIAAVYIVGPEKVSAWLAAPF